MGGGQLRRGDPLDHLLAGHPVHDEVLDRDHLQSVLPREGR